MKNSRGTGTENLKLLVLAGCIPIVALCARPALAHNPWVESHVAASYGFVLGKGEAAGRNALVVSPADPGDTATGKGKLIFESKSTVRGDKLGPHLKGRIFQAACVLAVALAPWPGCTASGDRPGGRSPDSAS